MHFLTIIDQRNYSNSGDSLSLPLFDNNIDTTQLSIYKVKNKVYLYLCEMIHV